LHSTILVRDILSALSDRHLKIDQSRARSRPDRDDAAIAKAIVVMALVSIFMLSPRGRAKRNWRVLRRMAAEILRTFPGKLALKELLATAEIVSSRAVGGATLYQIRHAGTERMIVTLPEGGALLVGTVVPAPPERRNRRNPSVKASAT
jgi:hypothetical protein